MTPTDTISLTDRRPSAMRGSVGVFAGAARVYWLRVFPAARAAQRELLTRAESIPDPVLRRDALISHRAKGSNSEGLAAMAVLAPPQRRAPLARSLAAYQLMLDYLDCISERPAEDPVANGMRLHHAFEVALDPDASHDDYYALAPAAEDGGYLVALIDACRGCLFDLPSYASVRGPLLHQARLCRESQALNHAQRFVPLEREIADWAGQAAGEIGLDESFEWWELIAAAAASSLNVGALLALAASPNASEAEACQVEAAYFPWASGLNAMLDSLVDLDEDPEDASHVRRYKSPEVGAERLRLIADGARGRVRALPDGRLHEAILAAMGALYLAQPEAWRPDCDQISEAVLNALGPFARPSLAVHFVRRRGRGAGAMFRAKRRSRARL